MHKRIEWKNKLRPIGLRQDIVWNLALPASRDNVVDELYDRYPDCHRRRDDPICVHQDRVEIANIIQMLDWMRPEFDEQKYGAIVRTAYNRLIPQVICMLAFSLSKGVQQHRESLEDSNWPRVTFKHPVDEGKALLDSVNVFGRLMKNFLALKAAHTKAITMPDKKVDPHVFKTAHRVVKLLANDRLNPPFDDNLIRMFEHAAAK